MKLSNLKKEQTFKYSDLKNIKILSSSDEKEYFLWDEKKKDTLVVSNDIGNDEGYVAGILTGNIAKLFIEEFLEKNPITCTHCGKQIATLNKKNIAESRYEWLKSMIGHAHNNICPITRKKNQMTMPETYLVVESKNKTLRQIESEVLREIPYISMTYCGDFVASRDEDDPIWTGEPYELEISTYSLNDAGKRFLEKYFNLPEYSLYEIDGIKVR